MDSLPLVSALAGFLVASPIITALSLLYLREYRLRKRAAFENQEVAKETEKESSQLLQAAQMAETQVLTDADISIKQMEEQFQDKLNEVLKSSTQTAENAQKQLFDFLGELKNQAAKSQAESQKSLETRVSGLFEKLETRLSDFLIKTEQSTTTSIELELRSARHLIDSYKTQQLALIDENIVAMMEQTLNIVLAKKLSLKDQLDLIYEALEKAKMEKFLA